MDNEEKFNQANGEQTPRYNDNGGNVRYRKVNVYSGNNNAFDRSDNRSSYRGGGYNRGNGSRGYRSYREGGNRQESYRQTSGGSYRYGNGEYSRNSVRTA